MKLLFGLGFIAIFLLGVSFVWAISNTSQDFCINEGVAISSSECEVGCCLDPQGFEHEKYPRGLCEGRDGEFYKGVCRNSFICN